jgi:nucleoside-diphosphate-sugar epimerase
MKFNNQKNKTAIVTGGAGFIGSHMSKKLAKEGYSVIIIDNLFRGSLNNLGDLLNDNNHSFYKIDLTENSSIIEVHKIIMNIKPALIMHYAAVNGTQYFYDEPAKVAVVNSLATLNLLKSIEITIGKDSGYTPKLYFSSTSEVYGEPLNIPTYESDITYMRVEEDRDSYAAAKLMSEFYVRLYAKTNKFPYIITRIFNVYGPKMIGTKYGQVIPEFITRLLTGEYPLNILGNGEHTRSFCYIDDHVDLTMKLIDSGIENEVINLGNPTEISIRDVASLVMNQLKMEPKFNFKIERKGDHMRRCPDISKMKQYVGNYDFTCLEVGVQKTIEFYKQII